MKIVHVVRQFAPAIGGLEEAVQQLAREQQHSGLHEVRIVTLDRLFRAAGMTLPHRDTVAGLLVARIPFAGSHRYPLAPSVLRQLADADIVHVHAIDFFFDWLAWTSIFHRKTLIASTHGGFFHTDRWRRLKQLWFRTMTAASATRYAAICASSEADAQMFRIIAPRSTTLVRNGVDIAKWNAQASVGLIPTLLCLGRFSSNKRLFALFPVLRALRDIDPDWRLIIAGMESDLSADDLEAVAEQQGVVASVKIVTGASNEAIAKLIAQSSYAISASAHEGFGLAVVEALSAGLYPVLSDIPAFRTISSETGRGIVVDFDSPDKVADAIVAHHGMRTKDHSAERLANIAASAQYGWPEAAAQFEAVYRSAKKSFRE